MESIRYKFDQLINNQFLIMKKFIFGLILMLFAFSTLPVQANSPNDGVKIKIVKADVSDFVNVSEVSFEVPQVHLYNHCNYRPAELWNYNFGKSTGGLLILKKPTFANKGWLNNSITNLKSSCIQNKVIHIDPGSFSC